MASEPVAKEKGEKVLKAYSKLYVRKKLQGEDEKGDN